jgi:hypothetical protein
VKTADVKRISESPIHQPLKPESQRLRIDSQNELDTDKSNKVRDIL